MRLGGRIVRRVVLYGSVAAISTAWTSVAGAQTAPAIPQPVPAPGDAAVPHVEEVVVTAQRRSEKLQNVPIAVSAVTATQLSASGISGSRDLNIAVPSLYIGNAIGFSEPRLRGVGSTTIGPGIENSVATYVDGVYYASSTSNLLSFTNIQRVEVLKGPQGTLFGRNATGGLVQVITLDPSEKPTGSFNLGYGNYDTYHADGYISSAIVKDVAADFSIQYDRQGQGWGHNVFNGRDVDKTNYDIGMRSKVVYRPTSKTKITVSADFTSLDGNPFQGSVQQGTLTFLGQVASYSGRYDVATTQDDHLHYDLGGASVHVEQELGPVRLISITADRVSEYQSFFDADATPAPFENVKIRQNDRQLSQEFQLQSNMPASPLKYTVGFYYFDADGRFNPLTVDLGALAAPVLPPPLPQLAGLKVLASGAVKTESYAGYAEGTYALPFDTNLTGGVRYTDETKSLSGNAGTYGVLQNGALLALAPLQTAAQSPAKAHPVTFRAALDHHFSPDVMVYASFNRGFKSGGFNAGNLGDPSYRPEKLDAYELGLKSELFDRRLTANVSGFYYDYSDIQIAKIEGTSSGIVNGPSAELYGLDADFEAAVTRAFRVRAGLTLLHDALGTYLDAPVGTATGGFLQHTGSVTGNQLPLASKASASLEPSYTIDLKDDLSLRLAAALYYNSGWKWEVDNLSRQKAFDQVNLTAQLRYGPVTGSLYVNNLTNVQVLAANATDSLGSFFATYRAPRTFGVTVGYKF